MAYTDYEVLKKLEDILKVDNLTYTYGIYTFLDLDDIPSPNMCPCVCLLPLTKSRELRRIGGSTPYNTTSTYEAQCWAVGLDGYAQAYKLVTEIEENVFNTLTKDAGIAGKVKTSVIGDTLYEYDLYDSTYYMVAKIQVVVSMDQ